MCMLMLLAPTDLGDHRQFSGTLQLNTKLHEHLASCSQVARRQMSVSERTSNTQPIRTPHTRSVIMYLRDYVSSEKDAISAIRSAFFCLSAGHIL